MSELRGELCNAETAIARRFDASAAHVPSLSDSISVIEQRIPDLQAALAELRVARAQTDQLDLPTSVYDFAPPHCGVAGG